MGERAHGLRVRVSAAFPQAPAGDAAAPAASTGTAASSMAWMWPWSMMYMGPWMWMAMPMMWYYWVWPITQWFWQLYMSFYPLQWLSGHHPVKSFLPA